MKGFILVISCVVMLSGCTWFKKPTCEQTDKYSAIAGERIASFLDCKNPVAVAASLRDTVDNLKLCTNPVEAGALSSVLCRPVAMLVAGMAVKGLPAAWECSGGAGAKAVESAVYSACALLPY